MRDNSAAGRPRAAIFPGFLGPAGGGTAQSACLMAASLAARGCRVLVEGLRDGAHPDMPRDLPLDACDVRVHSAAGAVDRLRSIVSDLDVVHFNGHWNPLNHALSDICHAAGVPYIISSRSSADPANMDSGIAKNLSVLIPREHRYVSNAFAVHVTSSMEKRRARFEATPRRLLTIRNPVELDHLSTLPSRSAARRALGIPDERIALLYYGRLVAQKQPDFAVRVLARLDRHANVHLYLVGAGTDEEIQSVRGAANALSVDDRVHVMGHASGGSRAQWLAAADALLLPSIAENFSLTLVESVAAGLPAVVCPNVGVLEYLQPADAAVVALDTRLWADACAGLLEAAAGPREKPLTRLQSLFHPDQIAQEWCDVYEQLRTPVTRLSQIPVIRLRSVLATVKGMNTEPTDGRTLSFTRDIRPMFRDKDRESMLKAFDLFDHADVAEHADAIVGALRSGKMPCDGAWPASQVDKVQQWIDAGKPA